MPGLARSADSRSVDSEGLRCDWSNRAEPGVREVALPGAHDYEKPVTYHVCPQHEAPLRAHHERMQRNRTRFFAAMFVVLFSAVTPVFTESLIGLAVPLAALGASLLLFPFATPTTVRNLGIAGSMLLLRLFGAVLLVFAALFTGIELLL